MRLLSAIAFLTLLTLAFAADAAPASSPSQVEIPSDSGTLHAQLYKPDGDGPFPVVIALHGCGGLAGHSEPVQARYRDWAEQLLKGGNAVLLPDSYGSRELGPQCRVNVKERRVLARRERVADIMASREWLVQQPWAARDRISLMGWANGASAPLWAVRPRELSAARDRGQLRRRPAGEGPCWYRHGSARRFAKARRGMAGTVASPSPRSCAVGGCRLVKAEGLWQTPCLPPSPEIRYREF